MTALPSGLVSFSDVMVPCVTVTFGRSIGTTDAAPKAGAAVTFAAGLGGGVGLAVVVGAVAEVGSTEVRPGDDGAVDTAGEDAAGGAEDAGGTVTCAAVPGLDDTLACAAGEATDGCGDPDSVWQAAINSRVAATSAAPAKRPLPIRSAQSSERHHRTPTPGCSPPPHRYEGNADRG